MSWFSWDRWFEGLFLQEVFFPSLASEQGERGACDFKPFEAQMSLPWRCIVEEKESIKKVPEGTSPMARCYVVVCLAVFFCPTCLIYPSLTDQQPVKRCLHGGPELWRNARDLVGKIVYN